MKHLFILAALFFIGAGFVACNKSISHGDDYYKSYVTWQDFKKSAGNSYRYMVVGGSWVGSGWQTVITVTGGRVTQRYFKYTPPRRDSTMVQIQPQEWTENRSEIGTHMPTAAADPVTLDVIYDRAETDWLRKRDGVTTYFEAKNEGMISSCGYVPDGCQDDCFVGIDIRYVQPL